MSKYCTYSRVYSAKQRPGLRQLPNGIHIPTGEYVLVHWKHHFSSTFLNVGFRLPLKSSVRSFVPLTVLLRVVSKVKLKLIRGALLQTSPTHKIEDAGSLNLDG